MPPSPVPAAPDVSTESDVEAERRFRSVAHPGEASAALVRSRAMVRPLVVTFVPVMVAALAATLAGQRIWPHLFWSAGVALTLAWGWAEFQMRRTPAEVLVRSAQQAAAVRSVHGILRGDAPNWQPLVRARPERMPAALRFSLGDRTHRLLGHRWPRLDALEDALQRALHVS